MSWPFSTTAERLLEVRSLSEISVDDLAKGAGISRPTFYFYFPSKDAVLLTLVERVIAEADRNADEAMGGMDAAVDPARGVEGHQRLVQHVRFASRGHPRRRGSRPTNPEVRALWSRFMQKWIDHTTVVDPGRTRPRRRAGDHSGGRSGDVAEPDERADDAGGVRRRAAGDRAGTLVDTLAHIWVTSIYGKAA